MIKPIGNAHPLLTAAMAVAALIGWGAYSDSVSSSAMRDQERIAAIARMETDRDGLVLEQQRLQRELSLAHVQLTAAHDEIASFEQLKVAKKGDLGAVDPVEPPPKAAKLGPKARSEQARVASARR